jgi:hypothetical protein
MAFGARGPRPNYCRQRRRIDANLYRAGKYLCSFKTLVDAGKPAPSRPAGAPIDLYTRRRPNSCAFAAYCDGPDQAPLLAPSQARVRYHSKSSSLTCAPKRRHSAALIA